MVAYPGYCFDEERAKSLYTPCRCKWESRLAPLLTSEVDGGEVGPVVYENL